MPGNGARYSSNWNCPRKMNESSSVLSTPMPDSLFGEPSGRYEASTVNFAL